MKGKWSIVLAVVLVLALTFTIAMVGCKTEEAVETTAAEEVVETTAAETTAAETAAETTAAAGEQFITIHWAQWAPADNLQALSDDFTAETGIKVIVEQTPWETFVQKYNTEMIAQSDAWDIIVADSQDLGNMAINGHFLELTDFVKEKGILDRFLPSAMYYYAEYPKGFQRYWAVPVEGDCLGWAYRKDLFENPDNMAAFKDKYGYDLGVPTSWDMIKDIAEFFYNPDEEFYGVAIYGDNGYDSLAMFAMQTIRAYGGDLGDFKTFKVDGLLNSEGAIKGIEYYRELFKFVPPGFGDAFYIATNDAFVSGIVPMATNYFAFFPGLATEATNPYAKDTGYFTCPPQVGADGKERLTAALGGQGASVVKYSKKQDLALKWLEWFGRDDTQAKWGMMPGSFTCNKATLESDEFLNAWPFNPNMKESFEIFQDWWAVPQYDEMLRIFSEELGRYVIAGEGSAEEALQTITEAWEGIFDRDGYYAPDFDPNNF